MPWYSKDYNADVYVRAMNDEQDLAFRRMLEASWEIGALPSDAEQLALIVRYDLEKFKKAWVFPLTNVWKETPAGLINPRLEKERRRVHKRIKTARENGSRGGRPRNSQNALASNENRAVTGRFQLGFKSETQSKPEAKHPDPDPDPDPQREDPRGASSDAPLGNPPVYWDNGTRDITIDRDWLRAELAEIQRESGQMLTRGEYDREREALRLKLLETPRQRACLVTQAGKRSKPSQFKALATYTVGWFSRAIRLKAQRANQPARASPNSTQARKERTDAAFREVMAETLEEERNGQQHGQKKRDDTDHREAQSGLSPAAGPRR